LNLPAPPRITVSCNKRDEAFLAQVFDTYKPRNLETLEAFAISELAEELEQDPQELAQAIRERQRKPFASASASHSRAPAQAAR
jgi:hypothetical protein